MTPAPDFLRLREEQYAYVYGLLLDLTQEASAATRLTDETFSNVYRAWYARARNPDLDLQVWLEAVARNNYRNYRKSQSHRSAE